MAILDQVARAYIPDWLAHDQKQIDRLAQSIQDAIDQFIEDAKDSARELEAQRDDPHERAAARARANDFEDTGGKDWT